RLAGRRRHQARVLLRGDRRTRLRRRREPGPRARPARDDAAFIGHQSRAVQHQVPGTRRAAVRRRGRESRAGDPRVRRGADTLPTTAAAPLVQLDSVTAVRAGGEIAVNDVTWTVRPGETWGVVGPVASGKTALAETLIGRHHVRSGDIRWPLIEQLRA